jgi:F-type H+-transporting ATPase subunit delta
MGGTGSGLAARYADALFDLARDEGRLDAVSSSLDTLAGLLGDSAELRRLIGSPLVSRAEGERAMLAAADAAGLDPMVRGLVGVMARGRRLPQLPAVIAAFRARAAAARGEANAIVTSAHPLSDEQAERLRETIAKAEGRAITLERRVDPSLLGGLVVQIGSRRIDSSIRTKLAAMSAAMKG